MVNDMKSCLDGKHVLFRNDPTMTDHFLKIAQRARVAENGSLILTLFLSALALICIVIATSIFVLRRRRVYNSRVRASQEPLSPRPRQSDYSPIISQDENAWKLFAFNFIILHFNFWNLFFSLFQLLTYFSLIFNFLAV
jgi:hypothetical protein